MSGNQAAAEDLAQDAFIAVHQRWESIDDPGAYARRTLANLASSRFRRLGREANALARMRARRQEFTELAPDDAKFWRAVAELPTRQRAVVALFYVDDRSVAQIAEALQVTAGTVKSTLHDARATLAASLGASYSEEVT